MPLHPFRVPAALCWLPLALAACGETPHPDPRTAPPLVRAAAVEGATPASRAFDGTVAARVQSDLSFRVGGKVLERLVDTGQTVERGHLLMRLDPADLVLAARAQEELVAAARARAQHTASDERRNQGLLAAGAITAAVYEQGKAAADAAAAQLEAAEAQAQVARNANRYTELRADADGVVVETLAEPGQVVGTGQVVVRVAQAGRREAVIQLPETFRPAVGSIGLAMRFGQAGDALPARLRQLSDAADPQTRTFEARYVLAGKLANAPLGTTVTIRLPLEAAAQAGLEVPIGALFDDGGKSGVWVIGGEPATVHLRPVTVLQLDDEHARVAGRLGRGEQIVALGAHLLHEGDRVRVVGRLATAEGRGGRP